MPAKDFFIERITHFSESLLIAATNDNSDPNHNNIAKILRNGLAVAGFVFLEDFFKHRTNEILAQITGTSVLFNDLPSKLKKAVTVDVLESLSKQIRKESTEAAKILLAQTETQKISSTLVNTSYNLTQFAFGFRNFNLGEDDIADILKSFDINDPWNKMTMISSRIGLTSFPLKISFTNASNRRHTSAHTPHSNPPINDLIQYVKEALGMAISFDSLISKVLYFINSGNVANLNTIQHGTIRLSFIKYDKGRWKYFRENNTRAIKADRVKNNLLTYATRSATSQRETLIVYDNNYTIENWFCF